MDPAGDLLEAGPSGVEGILPEVAGTVADEYVDSRDLAAAVLDMAKDGYLRLEYAPAREGEAGGLSVLEVKPSEGLPPHRKALVDLLISPDGDGGRGEGARVLDAVYAEAAGQGFFRKDPSVERRAYIISGTVMLSLAILLLAAGSAPVRFFLGAVAGFGVPFFLARWAMRSECPCLRWGLGAAVFLAAAVGIVLLQPFIGDGGVSWLAKLGVGMMFCGFFFFAFSSAMPQRTALGAAEKARVLSNRLSLEMFIPHSTEDHMDLGFQKGLPFAVIFRIRTDWVRKFAAAGARVPAWWKRKGDGDGSVPLAKVQADFLASLDLLTVRIQDSMPSGAGG
jgi:hypothetical protein